MAAFSYFSSTSPLIPFKKKVPLPIFAKTWQKSTLKNLTQFMFFCHLDVQKSFQICLQNKNLFSAIQSVLSNTDNHAKSLNITNKKRP